MFVKYNLLVMQYSLINQVAKLYFQLKIDARFLLVLLYL